MDLEEYEREGREAYVALAETISAILTAAISAEGGYRLQQIRERAKQSASLRHKLEQRGIGATKTLESEIKDLAGCRVIFYTNGDVTRFINSGIVDQNFEVLEVKLHHPRRAVEDAVELYISNHFIVRLRPERTTLPEYARFAGMRCEIQIQTVLNHAWAEMAHDTIYKAPALGDFGAKEFDGIKSRMQKVARKYLVPAGYEFEKIAIDFQRLIDGKALFDGDALEAIVRAADNNLRAEALETFADNVLPLYDDLQAVYPGVVARLVAAADRARTTPETAIETPYGLLPGKTYRDVVGAIADILKHYRYVDVEGTFDALRTLYGWAKDDDGRKSLLQLGEALAKYQLDVWRQRGPIVQAILTERIKALNDDERGGLAPLLTAILAEILGAEIHGITSSSSAVTLHRGAVGASEALRAVRTEAIGLLKRQFDLSESDQERRAVLLALQSATRHPIGTAYSNALARIVMDDTYTILEFQTEIAPTLSLELLQTTENWVHRCYWIYADLPETMRDDADLVLVRARIESAALSFRSVANAIPEFVIYKTLIGFNSVYPPAWENKEFRHDQAEAYRAKEVDRLLSLVDESNADAWFDRISRYAQTESNDAATFPVFGHFLERLAQAQPTIVLGYIKRLVGPLSDFLPAFIAGLMRSAERAQMVTEIDTWVRTGVYLDHLSWYLRSANPFDEHLLRRTLNSAIEHGDSRAVRNAMSAAVSQFDTHPGRLVEEVFLPALQYLSDRRDLSWVRVPWQSWLNRRIIHALELEQANLVLDALVPYPKLESNAEYIAATIADRWPAAVICFIGKRQAYARTDAAPARYDAVPFEVRELEAPLAASPDIIVQGARTWFDADPEHFTYEGGKLLASVFPDLSKGLEARLAAMVSGGSEQDIAFVIRVLSAFEGRPCIYNLVRSIVATLDPASKLMSAIRSALRESGMVFGEFGLADQHADRKALLKPWLDDPSENVRAFASAQIRELDTWIASDTRSAEASIAMRKLSYGEELVADKEG